MAVKPGYKQTDIGIIPENWDLKMLGDIAEITKLAGFEYTNYFNSYKDGGEIIVVRGTNITNNELDLSDVKTIPRRTSDKLQRSKLQKGDLVFAYVGTIGPIYLIEEDDKYHLGPNTARITVKNNISPRFVYCYFCSNLAEKEISEQVSVGAQPSLSMTKIRKFKIGLPDFEEQRAIAAALNDVDALLASLDALITKKRLIKQGTMQELLTSKRRLPGFSGEWETKKLGDLLSYEQPGQYIVKDTDYSENGRVPVLTAGKTFILGFTDKEEGIFTNTPVIIFDDFTTASKYVDFPFKVKSSAMKLLKPRTDETNLRFVFDRMQIMNFSLGDHKRYYISEYQHLEILTPPPTEQIAIAEILSDMDAEIQALEQRRAKIRLLKQGMMQELLTGRIRLI